MTQPTAEWLAYRQELHQRYEELAGLSDSSRLGFLNGPRHRLAEEDVVELWREAANASDRRRDAINHVYIHVPFCKSICSFCNYERLRPSSSDRLERYTDRVFRSLYKFGPVVEPMTWHTLYFGGGTPSVLPAPMLKKIVGAIDDNLRWHPHSTRFFEFDPAVFNQAKLDVLLEGGFEHFSFGVQTLDADVNAAHNRGPQSRKVVAKRFKELRAAGVFNISCDFLLGMQGTTPDQIVREVGEILSMGPRWIDLFFLTPTAAYVDKHFGGSHETFWEHIKPFHDQIPDKVKELARAHGYRVRRGHGHNIIIYRQMGPHERTRSRSRGIFSYTQLVDQQRRPLHLLGFGTSARSMIFGKAFVECRSPEEEGQLNADHFYSGYRHGMEGEVRRYLSHMLRDNNTIDRKMFREIFGVDAAHILEQPMTAWHALGKLQVDETTIRLAPEERRERFRTLLWAVPDEVLAHEVERYEQNLRSQARRSEAHRNGNPSTATHPA